MSRYGIHSRRMLTFLNKNPGANSAEIVKHLYSGWVRDEKLIEYEYEKYSGNKPAGEVIRQKFWTRAEDAKHYQDNDFFKNVKILDSRTGATPRSRGRFGYLLSPYCSRTLSVDPAGSRPHPGVANRDSQRMWFYRMKGPNCRGEAGKGRFIYFITLKGMAALEEHGA